MKQHISAVTIVVKSYDEAIAFYTQKLDFKLLEDTKVDASKRWVLLAPPGAKESCILLAKAANKLQQERIGDQTGGRVSFFLFTDNFERDFQKMSSKGVNFVRPKAQFDYGTVAVFEDLYGNLWDLIAPTQHNKALI